MKKYLSVLVLTFFSVSLSFADNVTWTGSAGTNNWHDGANWINYDAGGITGVPTASDYAIINSGFIVNLSTTETIQGTRVNGGTLMIMGTGELICSGASSPGIWAQGDVVNNGTISIANISHAGIQLQGKTFTNNGSISIDGTSQSGITMLSSAVFDNIGSLVVSNSNGNGVQIDGTSEYNNSGTLEIGNVGTIIQRGIFNSGTFDASSSSVITIDNTNDAALQNHGGTFTNAGVITLDKGNFNSKAIAASAVNPSFANSGTVNGVGAIQGKTGIFTNTGTIAPGFSPGSQTYQDGFNNTGTFEMELESTSSFDNLVFSGGTTSDFVVDGTVSVTLINGYVPVVGDEFKIIDAAAGYTGTLAAVTYTNSNEEFWRTDYNATDITLRYEGVVLPIKLTDFYAIPKDNEISLLWSTESELNNEGFELHKSVDGKSWNQIGWVPGQGEQSKTSNSYEFLDKTPAIGVNYYKLVQLDMDGARTEYDIVTAEYRSRSFEFDLYPNPAHETINIKTNASSPSVINIYNNSGELLITNKNNSDQINISQLARGEYWIEVISDAQKSIKTFVKS